MNIKNIVCAAVIAGFAINSTGAIKRSGKKNQVLISDINNLLYLMEVDEDYSIKRYAPTNPSTAPVVIVDSDDNAIVVSLKEISQELRKNNKRSQLVDFDHKNNSFLTKCNHPDINFAIVEIGKKSDENFCNHPEVKQMIAEFQEMHTQKQQK